jgi:hypothetical protein
MAVGSEDRVRNYFFISSARDEDEPYVRRFHADLEAKLQALAGARVGGLLDTRATTEPVDYPPAAKLQAMVALCSDRYLLDGWCGREWKIFTQRLENGGAALFKPFPGFLPLIWRPLTTRPRADIAELLATADFGEQYERFGLYRLMRGRPLGPGGYYAVVRAIAARVMAAQQIGLPPIEADQVRGTPPAFGQDMNGVGRARARPRRPSFPAAPPAESAKVVISYVGADQEWADWVEGLLRSPGVDVVQIRWNPLGGEGVAAMAARVTRERAGHVVVLLSGRYRAPYSEQPSPADTEEWEILRDSGPLGGRLTRVLLDRKPLPEPLRSMEMLDLSEFRESEIQRLLAAVRPGTPPAAGTPRGRLPGADGLVWTVPTENEFFTGRDDDLAQVRELLTSHGRAVLVTRDGLGDMGETEVAIEYLHRFKLRYDVVWWVSCQRPDRIREQVDELTRRLRERLRDTAAGEDDDAARRAARRLVVFAGATDPDALTGLIPAGWGHVLVVAESAGSWRADTVTVGPLSRAESVQLLNGVATMVDPGTAALIAALLADRPGLVAEVARYLVRRQEMTPELCLRLLSMSPRLRPGVPGGGYEGILAGTTTGRSGGSAAGEPPAAAEPAATAVDYGKAYVAERDVVNLLGELLGVGYVNDPPSFDRWLARLAELLGRRPDIPSSSVLATRLMAVIGDAVSQPGPGMLQTMARALQDVAPAEKSVGRFRRLVDQVSARWGVPDDIPIPAAKQSGGAGRAVLPGSKSDPDVAAGGEYLFFISYRRRADLELVRRFHEGLQRELGIKVNRGAVHRGFLDVLSIQGGAHWRPELRHASCTTPIMIALWSDDYFASDWCGREFAIFQERIRRATRPGRKPPVGIIPLNWLRMRGEVPACASSLQVTPIDVGSRYKNMPLVDLMREDGRIIRKFLIRLANRVLDITADPLPSLDVRESETIAPAFGVPAGPATGRAAP